MVLEETYDDAFFERLNVSKAEYSPIYSDDVVKVRFDISKHDLSMCAWCERVGPFRRRSLQPTGRPGIECIRCEKLHIETDDVYEFEFNGREYEYTTIKHLIEHVAAEFEKGVPKNILLDCCEELNIEQDELEHELDILRTRGEIYEPTKDCFRMA